MHLSALSLQNVQPNAPAAPPGNPGIAVAPSAGAPPPSPSAGGGLLSSPLLMVLMFAPILFFMFRRNKKEQDARKNLKKGDRIVSQSGLVGELMDMDERFAKVKLGPGNTVTMLTSSLQALDPTPAAGAKTDDKDLKDLKEAKALAEKK